MAQIVASQSGSSERGSALVELALVLPLLLVVIAGIVDFGFAFQRFEVVANAAREGARLGTKQGFSQTAIKQRVRDYIQQGLNIQSTTVLNTVVPVGSITVSSPNLTAPISGGSVTISTSRVDVFYHHQFLLMRPILGLINKTWGTSITLKATSVMSLEGA
jgi:Flp pilus assembly protein TadG